MARVTITIEADGAEITVEEYIGPQSADGSNDNTCETLASAVRRALAATVGPNDYGAAAAKVSCLLAQVSRAPHTSPLMTAAASLADEMRVQHKLNTGR